MTIFSYFKYLSLLLIFASAAQGASEPEMTWHFNKVKLIGSRAHVLRASEEMEAIYRTESGERLLNSLADGHFTFLFSDWQSHNTFHKKTEHTHFNAFRQANDWNARDWNFTLSFDPVDRNRRLDLIHPSFKKRLGTMEFSASLFRELLKSKLILDLNSTNYSENHLVDETIKYRDEIDAFTKISKTDPEHPFITFEGEEKKLDLVARRIEVILANPLGRKLFQDMKACAHRLRIFDDKSALGGAAFTAAEKTTYDVYIPGKGADVYIRARMDIPETGSHLVTDADSNHFPFTAIENLFHELVHAKHMMCGTLAQNAEAQAIAEENAFRRSTQNTAALRDHTRMSEDRQIWFGLKY